MPARPSLRELESFPRTGRERSFDNRRLCKLLDGKGLRLVLQTPRRGSFVTRIMGRQAVHDLRERAPGEQFVCVWMQSRAKGFGKKTFLPRFTRTTNSTALHLQPHASTPSTSSYPGPPRNRTTSFAWTMMDLWLGRLGISGNFKPSMKRVFPDRGRRSRGRHPRP